MGGRHCAATAGHRPRKRHPPAPTTPSARFPPPNEDLPRPPPPYKRDQIRAIAALIQSSAEVETIILFGSYARGDWVEDLPNMYFSDFDRMVVVATEQLAEDDALWARITDEARRIGGRIPVSLLVHDIKQLNQEIRTGQYFFSDVVTEGVLLHDSRRFMLARPKAQTPAERLELARRNFTYWFQSASEFWRGANYYTAHALGR
jgi:predicted nucleotidyltransferase